MFYFCKYEALAPCLCEANFKIVVDHFEVVFDMILVNEYAYEKRHKMHTDKRTDGRTDGRTKKSVGVASCARKKKQKIQQVRP